jgi:mRNA interferase RelE/StbE
VAYTVEIKRSAAKELAALPADARRRVSAKIESLANDPRPPGCEKLAGEQNAYRVRTGDYRIVYEIRDTELIVTVIRIGHRREVYR